MIIPVQPNGTQSPLIIAPGANARHEFDYPMAISHHLGGDCPVYTFNRLETDGIFVRDIADMAAKYVDELMTIQSSGPYRLLGFSFAAHVACAMAARLVSLGRHVAFVGIIDDDADVHRRGFNVENEPRDFTSPFTAALYALDRQPLQSYPGKITVFRGSNWVGSRKPGIAMDWENVAEEGIDVFEIPCSHNDAVSPTGLDKWAKQLAWCLGGADQQSKTAHEFDRPTHLATKTHRIQPVARTAFIRGKRGDLIGEITDYQLALKQQPDAPEWISINLAHALWQKRDLEQAITVLRNVADFSDDPTNAYTDLARLLKDCGRSQELKQLADAATDLPALDASDFIHVGFFYRLCLDTEKSEAAYRNCLAIFPFHVRCSVLLCDLLVGSDRADEAMDLLDESINHNKQNAYLKTRKAELLEIIGDDQAAEDLYRLSLHTDKFLVRTTLKFSNFLKRAGRLDEALNVVSDLLKVNPDNYNLLDNLAELYTTIGNLTAAEEAYRRSVDVWPYSESGYFGLSRVLEMNDQHDEAVSVLRKALLTHPNNHAIKEQIGWLVGSRGQRRKQINLMGLLHLQPHAMRKTTGKIEVASGRLGNAVFGPYLTPEPGRYRLIATLVARKSRGLTRLVVRRKAMVEIAINIDDILASSDVGFSRFGSDRRTVELFFNVSAVRPAELQAGLEIRIATDGGFALEIEDCVLETDKTASLHSHG
jgi:thioesterase domain-containing protein/tetratricopeptide (TPR) repeat protein